LGASQGTVPPEAQKVPQMPLTDVACKNAKCPPEKARARFADAGGLYLEVVPTGGKHWRWKYRIEGKEKRLALGSYPAVTLGDARAKREKARLMLKAGTDPVQSKKEEKLARKEVMGNTFEAVARAWFEHWSLHSVGGAKSARHAGYTKRRLEADILPVLGAKPISEIKAAQVLAMAKKIEERGALDLSRRAWQVCGQIFEYGIAHAKCDRNPARDVKPGVALKGRAKTNFARLDAKEMPELLRKIRSYPGSPYTRMAMELMALTFVRTGELIAAHWDEFDLDAAEWRIPKERMKMKTPHIVPLSTQAVDLLRSLHELKGLSGLLFPGERDHEKPMSNGAILGALRRMGYAGRMTGHGFRGVASTILHEHNYDHAHIELQLAHMERDAVSAAYNFATYLPQRRKMMQAYADHLDQLRQGAKILTFKAA
jgi:integrase